MKKFFVLFLSLFLISGCDNNKLIDAKIYATMYPIEYATKYMYGEFSNVKSIYPSGADINTYELTDKQKDLYSKSDIFIYAATVDKELKTAVDFRNNNANLMIIDATKLLDFEDSSSELWLNPTNYLVIIKNIKSNLLNYEKNIYNQEKLNSNYDKLNEEVSKLDVDLTLMGNNASRKNLLVADNTFNYLTRYNINVISIDPDSENLTKNYNEAKSLISSGDIKYIYTLKGVTLSKEIEEYITNNKLEKLEIDPMYTLSDEDRKEGKDYLTIMNENITKLKTELFR